MRNLLYISLAVLALSGCQQKQSSVQESIAQTNFEQEDSVPIEQSEEQNISTDFISGGNTYVGTKVNDVETSYDHGDVKKGDIVRYETHYTIKCFKDGTMTWTESLTENNGEPNNKNFEGEWKKVTISKHDVIYTWYEFWATTYDIHATPHYSRIGFIDEKGQLYFEGADPEREIPENSRTFVECTVTAQ